ncbi:hypothetical protein Tco_0724985 [Tanacetum coccineum]|uniref:Bet v I/Major latex protein domain-containing protein n=1 Tax=Tanacetum coccineum TaxID=301880 RepID=A0ABQ4YBK7_9ASTR
MQCFMRRNQLRSITSSEMKSKEIEVAKTGTEDNAADAFTKVVPGARDHVHYAIKDVDVHILTLDYYLH